ncbi:MAG: 4-hydroxy-tetrahydrodipicolinate synthase [Planctomycetota bacterium]|jgi:4-hydroxy-tetrahydrodipicolinate synthase
MPNPFQGSIVALPTPLRDGQIDFETFAKLIKRQIGISDAIVVAGTTGEAMSLTDKERRGVIYAAVEAAKGEIKVLAGVGTSVTAESIELARFSTASGADGLLVVAPPYTRPSRRGLAVHFSAIAESTTAPIVLYDVPGRTGVGMDVDLVRHLRQAHANIVAIKVSTPDWDRMRTFIADCGIPVLCGDDGHIVNALEAGACGSVNVIGNVVPELMAELSAIMLGAGDAKQRRERATQITERLTPLLRDLSLDVNPIPVKCALSILGYGNGELRAPLLELEEADRLQLASTLDAQQRVS